MRLVRWFVVAHVLMLTLRWSPKWLSSASLCRSDRGKLQPVGTDGQLRSVWHHRSSAALGAAGEGDATMAQFFLFWWCLVNTENGEA